MGNIVFVKNRYHSG